MATELIAVRIPRHVKAGEMCLRIADVSEQDGVDIAFDVPPLMSGKQVLVGVPVKAVRGHGASVTHAWLDGRPLTIPVVQTKPPKVSMALALLHSKDNTFFITAREVPRQPKDVDLMDRLSQMVDATRERVASVVAPTPPPPPMPPPPLEAPPPSSGTCWDCFSCPEKAQPAPTYEPPVEVPPARKSFVVQELHARAPPPRPSPHSCGVIRSQDAVSSVADNFKAIGDTFKGPADKVRTRTVSFKEVNGAQVTSRTPSAEVLRRALALNESFQWAQARELLLPFAEASHVRTRCALAESCLFLAEAALTEKRTREARELAKEALAHATAATKIGPSSAIAHAWYGQCVQVKAKAADGQMEQGRVLAVSVASWERAHQLDPLDPLPLHLLGSCADELAKLPWVAAKALRSMSPKLKEYTIDDALTACLESERLMPNPPHQYSVINRKIIGLAYLKKEDKEQAKRWLLKAVDGNAVPDAKMDASSKAARKEAAKAIRSL
ncbi:hypothetical protein AB1Y20_002433 [Prymnesium parvum]|uniref:Uncharacterized protein n=1 Tax=Prymnesium parvum TaxID=97485 RepID=A0AB34J928_PRYPA